MTPLILIADDDPGVRQVLAIQFVDAGYRVSEAADGREAVKRYRAERPLVLLTDLRMPHQDGQAVLAAVLAEDPEATVVVMTAYASVEGAVEVMKAGAFDFITKPFHEAHVLATVERAVAWARLKRDNQRLRDALTTRSAPTPSCSPRVNAIYAQAFAVADTDAHVLILGETGTGKEHLARAIHDRSPRAAAPWVVVNCGALPETLVEAELFGHAKGAFTGADHARPGRLLAADGGTLFLDEIGDLPLAAQVKLLRFLQGGEVQAVGADRPVRVDARVIAATHQDLRAMMARGRFRNDLYYRLAVITLAMPPLRERRADLARLAAEFLQQAAQRHGRELATLSAAAVRLLEEAPWPGNIRELKNLCERWALLYPAQELTREQLAADLLPAAAAAQWQLPPAGADLAEVERQLITQALARTGGNKAAAARLLHLTRHTLDYRLEKHGL